MEHLIAKIETQITTPVVVVPSEIRTEIEALKNDATAIEIKDQDSANKAAMLLGQATTYASKIEKCRESVKRPFIDMGKNIDTAAKSANAPLEESKDILKKKLAAWNAEQDRIRKEAEAAAAKEKERIEADAQKERERIAAEEAKLKDAKPLDCDDVDDIFAADETEKKKAELEKQKLNLDETTKTATAEVDARQATIAFHAPAGVKVRKVLDFEVTDINKVPEEFLVPREVSTIKVKSAHVYGWKEGDAIPEVPGLKFVVKDDVKANTRRGW